MLAFPRCNHSGWMALQQTQVAAQIPGVEYGRNAKARYQLVGSKSIDFGGIAEPSEPAAARSPAECRWGGLHDRTSTAAASEEGLDEIRTPELTKLRTCCGRSSAWPIGPLTELRLLCSPWACIRSPSRRQSVGCRASSGTGEPTTGLPAPTLRSPHGPATGCPS